MMLSLVIARSFVSCGEPHIGNQSHHRLIFTEVASKFATDNIYVRCDIPFTAPGRKMPKARLIYTPNDE